MSAFAPPPPDPTKKKTAYAPPGSPGWTATGPDVEGRSGASHFGGAPIPPSTGPAVEDRTGVGHVGGAGAATPPATDSSGGLLSAPGAYEQWIKEHAGDLNTPTNVEDLYGGGATSVLDNSPLNSVTNKDSAALYNDWLSTHGSVSGAGNSKSVLDSLPSGPSKSSDVYKTASGTLSGKGATEQTYDKNSGAFDDPGAREAWYAQYGGDPMEKSYTEKLYEGGIGQLDPTYDYASKKALEKARIASSARGEFNSSYAGQEERDILDNLYGQQASKWVDLAPEADKQRLARYDQGERFAGDSNSDYRQRLLDTFDIAGKNDKATLDRLDTLSTIAGRGDSADTANNNTRVTAAGNADRSAVDIYNSEQGAQKTGADLTREQGDQNIDLAGKQDAANRNNLNTKFDLAGAADSSKMGRFLNQAGLEKDLQNTGQNRITGGLDATAGLSKEEADIVLKAYGDFSDVDWTDTQALQALADKYGVSLQELESVKGDAKSFVSLVASALKK